MEHAKQIKFNKTHEWVKINADEAYIGISDHAQESLGDVVFFEVSSSKKKFHKGDSIGSIESVKAVSEIYAPINCELIEVNPEIADNPGIINSHPHSEGWLLKVKPLDKDANSLADLMSEQEYQKFIQTAE